MFLRLANKLYWDSDVCWREKRSDVFSIKAFGFNTNYILKIYTRLSLMGEIIIIYMTFTERKQTHSASGTSGVFGLTWHRWEMICVNYNSAENHHHGGTWGYNNVFFLIRNRQRFCYCHCCYEKTFVNEAGYSFFL